MYSAIQWTQIVKIVSSWFISPLLSGLMAIGLYTLVSKVTNKRNDQNKNISINIDSIFFSLNECFVCTL